MIPKILGAALILIGCGGFGMKICMSYKREEEMLRQLIHALNYIQCELQFRMTPLPELCAQASSGCKGKISHYFKRLSEELTRQVSPDVSGCINAAKESMGRFPERVDKTLEILAMSLGQFDVQGQLQALETARSHCKAALDSMEENRDMRLRSYQTLGICAGAALVILLV